MRPGTRHTHRYGERIAPRVGHDAPWKSPDVARRADRTIEREEANADARTERVVMQRRIAVVGAIVAPMLLAPGALAGPVVFYEQTFEGKTVDDLPEWSGFVFLADNSYLSRFMGPWAQKVTTLTVPIPAGIRDAGAPGGADPIFTIEFDLFIIDSWGNTLTDPGDDRFIVQLDGVPIMDEVFSNVNDQQTFRAPDEKGPFAYSPLYDDSVYRDVKLTFAVPESQDSVTFDFIGFTTLAWQDESVGIDNIRVGYEIVPAPGSLALLGIGGLALGTRPRRNQR